MTADKSQPAEHSIEKQSVKPGDKPPAGTLITEQADNVIQQRLKAREALQAFRPTRDPSNSFRIDMGDGSEVKDTRPINQVEIVASGLAGMAPQVGVGEAGQLAPITPPQETQIAFKVHDPFEHLKHGVTDGVRHKAQEVHERQLLPHEGKEDQYVDYKAAREALHTAGLDKYHLPPNTIGAMLRNEQTHYKVTDQWQDEEVARTGTILKNGKEDSWASIGPAQMQVRNIHHLIDAKDANGDPKYPFLQHMKKDPLRGALDPKNAALLAAAYLADEIDNRHIKPKDVTAQSMAYLYNEDVHSYGHPKHYISCDGYTLKFQKIVHPDLKDEKYPSPEVLKHSNHVGNVMDSLKKVDEYEEKHSKQDKDKPH
jgi:hypothetical protein